jgi:3'-phosphoadenosine 5'-phosphosulfate sulfotransferase (PAPS reductase)/FAD synthetase
MSKQYHVVSFSGGKDSTAMLLRMMELGMPVDEIIFCDTGVEFPQMYEHLDRVEKYIKRPITRLKREHDYRYMLLEHEVKARDGSIKKGYSFTGMWGRWCTAYFKRDFIKKYLKDKGAYVQYIGIAADEPKRVHNDRYPLVDWGWTEADCLRYCYEHGFKWGAYTKSSVGYRVGAVRFKT